MTNQITPIFLLSMPRSGSTLCQRILASDVHIASAAEPTLLLPLLYMIKEQSVYSSYDHRYTARAVHDFCQSLPNGRRDYQESVHDFVLQLYAKAAGDNVCYFLDKTPKYHLIVDELLELFPEAKVIFLWRNPLAIIASLMRTWGGNGGRWNLQHFRIDLYEGLPKLVDTYERYRDRVFAVRYEDLVQAPHEHWPEVFSYLNLPFDPNVLTEFAKVEMAGRVQDPNVTKQAFHQVRADRVESWKGILANPLRKMWCHRYLAHLGSERLASMGYAYDEIQDELQTLPFDTKFLASDLYDMPYDLLFRLFELEIMKQKTGKILRREPIYAHK